MLVCSVSLRPKRGAIGAAVVESVNAQDVYSLGAVFAILAEDPGTASDYLDAFVGKRMVEPASATDTVVCVMAHPASVLEEISAAVSVQNASLGGAVGGVSRSAMVSAVFVNSDGTARQANANGTMLNL